MKPSWIVALVIAVAIGGGIVWRVAGKTAATQDAKSGAKKGQTPTVEVATAGPASVAGYLRAVGSLTSPDRVQLSPKTSGRILFLQVREGDLVKKGDVLVRIDPAQTEAAVTQARSNLAESQSRYAQAKIQESPNTAGIAGQIDQQTAALTSADADLEQVRKNLDSQVAASQSLVADAEAKVQAAQGQIDVAKAGVDKEVANLANAQVKADRAAALYEKGYVPGSSSEDAKTALEVQKKSLAISNAQLGAAQQFLKSTNAQLNVAKQNLQVTTRKGTSDIAASTAKRAQAASALKVAKANTAQNPAYRQNLAALSSAVDASKAQLDLAVAQRADTILRSSIDGSVTARNGDVGSLAQPGTPVLMVESNDWLFFECALPVDAAPQVRVGQQVRIHLDAIPDGDISGIVRNINPSADNASRQFTVLVRVDNPSKVLRPGMFGQADLVIQKVDAAVAIPREAIRPDAKGKSKVAVVDADGKVKLVDVVTGVQNEKLVEITQGVQVGDKVVVLAYGQVKDGMTVSRPGTMREAGS